jgi:hypothetical protein
VGAIYLDRGPRLKPEDRRLFVGRFSDSLVFNRHPVLPNTSLTIHTHTYQFTVPVNDIIDSGTKAPFRFAMSKFEVNYFGNELPKEDIQDVFRKLHLHSKDAKHPLLARFITQSTQVIKKEVERLPCEVKRHIPPFETILSWAGHDDLRDGLLCGAVIGVLLTIAQIGTYIG